MENIERSKIVVGVGLLVAACSREPTEGAGIGSTAQAIAGGVNDGNDPGANVVVELDGPSLSCTGTLITPTAVLTANHCVAGTDEGEPGMGYPVIVTAGNAKGSPVGTYRVSHPSQVVWLGYVEA